MCNGRLELTLWAPEVAWKHKISNALVLVVADAMRKVRSVLIDRRSTVQARLAEKPKKEKPAPAMPTGDMDD